MTFDDYMDAVNRAIEREVFVSAEDLPDYDFYSAWEDDIPVNETAAECLAEAGY